MNILVTGGLGFIGSHTVVSLYERGHQAVIIDDFSNASKEVLEKLETLTQSKIPFIEGNATDLKLVENIFKNHQIDGVLHFAAFKAVGESVERPIMYYENNLNATLTVAKLALEHKVNKFVFSSSCTVYGDQASPFNEEMEYGQPDSPYASTKQMSEQILKDISFSHPDFKVTLMRYFNPIGAHESGLIGESPLGIPNNLMPYILDVALGKRPHLNVYGSDYSTPDGTGVRDYIHVMDLGKAHVLALEEFVNTINIYNVGTGIGYSVLDIIKRFKHVNEIEIPYKLTERRSGDIAFRFADPQKIYKEIGFKSKRTLDDMLKDSWNFVKAQQNK